MSAITCGIYLYNVHSRKMLVCHATHASWKQWSIPKGLPEKHEDLWAAAVRELHEETGINISKLRITHSIQLPSIKYQKQNKILESFLVVVEDDLTNFNFQCLQSNQTLAPEVNQWKWITLAQANVWLHETQRKNLEVIKKNVEV